MFITMVSNNKHAYCFRHYPQSAVLSNTDSIREMLCFQKLQAMDYAQNNYLIHLSFVIKADTNLDIYLNKTVT
jgi:hypothetical protein